jgi:putative phosphoribosyl transferase
MVKRFRDRKEAGCLLAQKLAQSPLIKEVPLCVVALPRGGVPVAAEIAHRLNAPLDVLVVRKLGVPGQPELAFGAVASGNLYILNQEIVSACSITQSEIQAAIKDERKEVLRREALYRCNRPPLQVEGYTVILVDDGIATGATMRIATLSLAQRNCACLIVATPVAPARLCAMLRKEVDALVTLEEPQWMDAVGSWYRDFSQVDDNTVRSLLEESPHSTTPLGERRVA